jgi:aminoglycoside 6-adenylyltransferase
MTDYEQLEQRCAAWAQSQPAIVAIVVVGSRARQAMPADAWSDLDLVLFCHDPLAYTADSGWLEPIGPVEVAFRYDPPRDPPRPEWWALFAGGLKADFLFEPWPLDATAPDSLGNALAQSPARHVYRRGARVIFYRYGPPGDYTPALPPLRASPHPGRDEFDDHVHLTLFVAMRVARLLAHGPDDLWRAKLACDCELKEQLLTMIEWRSRAIAGVQHDTWYDGRLLPQWAAPEIVAELPATFAAYQTDSLWRALFASLALYRRLAHETADRLLYPYPEAADRRISEWINRCAAANWPIGNAAEAVD